MLTLLAKFSETLDLLPLLAKSLVATAAFAGLRQGELRGLEWTDYTGTGTFNKKSLCKKDIPLLLSGR
jgi:integrase